MDGWVVEAVVTGADVVWVGAAVTLVVVEAVVTEDDVV